MKYYRAVEGRIVRRYGTDIYIGARYVAGQGYVQDLKRVVAIPLVEDIKYRREYLNCMRRGELIEVTKSDFDQWTVDREAASKANAAARAVEAAQVPTPDELFPDGGDNALDGGDEVESETSNAEG
jgi:hypothetical protein